MFKKQTYQSRREKLATTVGKGLILLLGNDDVGMNYGANVYHFRQDSSFLYFIGIDQPGLSAVIDTENGTTTIFGDELTLEDIVWTGAQPSIKDKSTKVGIDKTERTSELAEVLATAQAAGRKVHFLPPYRAKNQRKIHLFLGIQYEAQKGAASKVLINAVVAQRSYKSAKEIVEMEKAVNISRAMHVAVMKAAKAGMKEAQLAGIAQGISMAAEGHPAYPIIMTVNGQVLHSHDHSNTLKSGQLVLGDYGGETKTHYAGDITRTFPVDKTFTQQQREIYEIVLKAENDCIAACKPGIAYRDIHSQAAQIIGEGLKDLGLMKGDISDAVAQGATALFFPHGLGHQIGLDVHDMEDLGEDFVGYSEHIKRSDLFGTAYLRLGRELEEGFVLTVEPGIYFIPELIDQWKSEGKFADFINYEKLTAYRDFSGIRIEDNVLITENGHRVLGKPIPKTVAEIEALRGGVS